MSSKGKYQLSNSVANSAETQQKSLYGAQMSKVVNF